MLPGFGEAISELARRHHNLISVKARLEAKASDRTTGEILATDRQVTVAFDLAEQIDTKTAFQDTGAN